MVDKKEYRKRAEIASVLLKSTLRELDLYIGFNTETKSLVFVDRESYIRDKNYEIAAIKLEYINVR